MICAACSSSTSAKRAPLASLLVETGQRFDRLGVGRIVLENLAPQLDANLRLAQALRREVGDFGVAQWAIGLVEKLDLRAHHLDQLFPVATLLVHVLEARDGLDIGAVDLENARVALDGFRLVRRLLDVELAGASVVSDLLGGVFDELRLADQRLDDVRPTLEALELHEALVERLELGLLVCAQLDILGEILL